MVPDRVDVLTAEEFVEKINEGIDFSFIYIPKTERGKLSLLAKERYDREKSSLNKYLFARTIFTFDPIKDRFELAKQLLLEAAEENYILAIYDVASALLEGHYNFDIDYKESFILMKKASDLGYIPATFELSQYYFQGIGTKVNKMEGMNLIQRAVDANYPSAIGTLGTIYHDGINVKKDINRAIELFMLGASKGDLISNYSLGVFYFYGEGVEVNYETAARYFEKAWEEGFIPAYPFYGLMHLEGKGVQRNIRKGLKMIEEAVKSDDERAICMLGDIYYDGETVPLSYEKAFSLFLRGAEMGITYCKQKLGEMYLDGLGVSKDETKAFEYFKDAAEDGNKAVYYHLGACYLFGNGVKKNYKLAFENMSIAYKNKIRGSAFMMARMYKFGIGTKKDEKKMVEAFKRSINEHDAFGCYYYAMYLRENNPSKKQKELINKLIKESADEGFADAQFALALNLKEEKKYDEYIQYLNMAAACGCANAFAELGYLYRVGEIVPKDDKKSFKFFSRGAKLGSQICYLALGYAKETGDGSKKSLTFAMDYYSKVDGTVGTYEVLMKIVSYLKYGVEYAKKNHKQVFVILKNMTERDDIEKPYIDLGLCYENGIGTKVDYPKAISYFKKAIKEGEEELGFLHLSNIYLLHKDEIKADELLEYVRSYADKGIPFAELIYANMLFSEKSDIHDDIAKEYFLKAANDGIADGYYYAHLAEKDEVLSKVYFNLGLEMESVICMCEKGNELYEEGKVEESNKLLLKSLKKSIKAAKKLAIHFFEDNLDIKYLDEVMEALALYHDDEADFDLAILYFLAYNDVKSALKHANASFIDDGPLCSFAFPILYILDLAKDDLYDLRSLKLVISEAVDKYDEDYYFAYFNFIYGIVIYYCSNFSKEHIYNVLNTYLEEKDVDKFILTLKSFEEEGFDISKLEKFSFAEDIIAWLKILIPFLINCSKKTNENS